MDIAFHTPAAPVDSHVETLFHYRGWQPDHSIERVVPSGHVFLIFELDGIERHTYDNDTLKPTASFRGGWVSGMLRHYISISAHPDSEMLVIQFRPAGARPFLHVSLDAFSERVVPGDEVFDGELPALRDRLAAAESREAKFTVAEAWLHERYRQDLAAPAAIHDVVERLAAEPGERYADAIADYPGSRKHLISEFRRYLGVTPKYYQRILRFNDVLRVIRAEGPVAWSAVAHHCGYADQSHFIRDFRHFSGFNPTDFLRQGFDAQTNFFPLDRRG
ncbi:helix-turn-helix domain-containing protein [Lentisalinibacter orientalis]|uniref:helix-turn-helix domain-containing protein n=1 Tax=Lentisalinibacter orientalis TaxID=2992241 RepID=UPI0038654185